MSHDTSLSYADLTRPQRDSATLLRSALRATGAHQQLQQRTQTAGITTTTGAGGGGDACSAESAVGGAPTSSLDTWTGFLSAQWAEAVRGRPPVPLDAAAHVAPPSTAELVSALHGVVARQSHVTAQLQERLMAQRAREEKDWEGRRRQSEPTASVDEAPPPSSSAEAAVASGGVHNNSATTPTTAAADGAVENDEVCVLLARLLESARHLWAGAVSEHFRGAEVRKATCATGSRTDRVAVISAESAIHDERVGLPPAALLFRCLVDGINSTAAQQAIIDTGVLPLSAWDSGVLGVDQLGILTVFQRHVQALRTFQTIVPPLEVLREFFAELHPQRLTTTHPCGALDSTLELAEAQLDALLRVGEERERVAALLRGGLHPSVRRLLYARALQVPLVVTDGKPLFLPQGELVANHLRHGLVRHLTCGSRQTRDKVRRRFHHHYSSAKQEDRARLLQRLTLDDMFISVGDSDKYFVYADDVEVLATAMVVDRSLPDPKLAQALRQLGRPAGQLEHYITYLQYPEKDLIYQKAPPCGFVPVAGCTLLSGALCNVTGDTVEQYELLSAMMAQLWGRLQSPTPELLQCALLFESLVQRLALPAVLHATRDLQYPPLALALPWMLTGFAELLDAAEVLSFWDLVLSYHVREMHRRSPLSLPTGLANAAPHDTTTPCALWLLPMYAAAIFVARAPLVEACRTAAEVDVVFSTGHQLRTRSILQGLLFG
ncbi:Rab-GTPase-TBC domain containing protein [Novymonas esmeraldas]|uniref:Rab-GTPase-TBC domain containing protein n=1 Tax=Novymonas esmeraldas TaxID=1808958 RepID=A0AAW0ERV2_9TRYP